VILLFAFVVLIVYDVFKHRLDLFNAAEKRHVMTLCSCFLVLLLSQMEIALFCDLTIDHVCLSWIKNSFGCFFSQSSIYPLSKWNQMTYFCGTLHWIWLLFWRTGSHHWMPSQSAGHKEWTGLLLSLRTHTKRSDAHHQRTAICPSHHSIWF
jgi:hypothetical protein